jgi:Cellulose binding domain/Periplasmic binding protein
LLRQSSASWAVEEINAAGGIPTPAGARPLVMIACDASTDLQRAADHLVSALRVSAIIGPNTSQDTLDVASASTIAAGTLVITPTGMSESIAHLLDDDLVWQLQPSDTARAQLLGDQIGALYAELSQQSDTPLKISVLFRKDVLGSGARSVLGQVQLAGKSLSELADQVRFDAYEVNDSDQSALVESCAQFQPDIVVLVGTAETVTQLMAPLEARWAQDDLAELPRPHYLLTDSSKVPELLELSASDDALRARIRGVGVGVPADPSAAAVDEAFERGYGQRFPGSPAAIFGVNTAHDATYAVAYALAALGDAAVSGKNLAARMRWLSDGELSVGLQAADLSLAWGELGAGHHVRAIGTLGPLAWDDDGAVIAGSLDVWCIGGALGDPQFASAGRGFDLASQQFSGSYAPCDAPASSTAPDAPAPGETRRAAHAAKKKPPVANKNDPPAPADTPDNAPAAPPSEPVTAPLPAFNPGAFSYTTHMDSQWQGGYCSEVDVQNHGSVAWQWQTDLPVRGVLRNYWSCTAEQIGFAVAFAGVSWNQSLEPGATTQFGYCVSTLD